jgi:hypothetical protein
MRVPALRAGLTEKEREVPAWVLPRFPDDTWLGDWLRCLCDFWHRVPPDIDREAFGRVVGVMLTRRAEVSGFMRYVGSCRRTGLWVPVPMPHYGPGPGFFPTCPGCGGERVGPSRTLACHAAAEPERPWREWPEKELSPE